MIPAPTISGYGWSMPTDTLILDVPRTPWKMRSTEVSQMDFRRVVLSEPHARGQHPDCLEQDEADGSPLV